MFYIDGIMKSGPIIQSIYAYKLTYTESVLLKYRKLVTRQYPWI